MARQFKRPPRAILKLFVGVHNFIYRASGGRLWSHFGRGPVLLLTVKGRKTGKPQTVPLIYIATERGCALIASFAGSPTNPAWYQNLEAAGGGEIQIGGKRLRVRTEPVARDDVRYDDIWRRAVALYPDYETYKARTTRQIPIVELVAEQA